MFKAAKTNNQAGAKNSYRLRIFLLLFAITVGIGLIETRLFYLQIVKKSYYQALAENQHSFDGTIDPKRGEIFLTPVQGDQPVLVATNVAKDTVYAVPKEIDDKKGTASRLGPLIEFSAHDLEAKFDSTSSYVSLKKELAPDVSEKIKSLKLKGIYLESADVRFYPEKTLASQVVGFLGYKGNERVGQYGVEGKFDQALAGQKGSLGADTDASGKPITFASRDYVPAKDGDDIYLTIDPAIQFKTEEVLKTEVEKHGADSGSITVMNPKTGAIMAMANFPSFDSNNYSKVKDLSVFSNKILSADYEPGSVFKPITMAAALNEGKVTADTTYEDTGLLKIDDKQIKNSDALAHGVQTMTQVLELSLNTGAVFAEQQIGNDIFKKYVRTFGFGKPEDFELSGQVAGNLANLDRKSDIFFATASFGQGITVTPLQLISAYTAIANEGKIMKPYIVDKIVHSDGSQDVTKPSVGSQILDPKTTATLSAMLVNVVENGHGKKAAVKGFYIAGKTGTAQVAFKDRAGYDPNTNIGSFIGFGPVENPQFLMLVRIDNPKDVKFAETTAAPAFGEIASFILNYLQIQPTRQ